jgi:hypothetical protein
MSSLVSKIGKTYENDHDEPGRDVSREGGHLTHEVVVSSRHHVPVNEK